MNYARRQQYRWLSRAATAAVASGASVLLAVAVREQARWLSRQRRRWCRRGAVPVICVVRARGVDRLEQNVLLVSIDRLIPVLRSVVGELGMYGLSDQRNAFE